MEFLKWLFTSTIVGIAGIFGVQHSNQELRAPTDFNTPVIEQRTSIDAHTETNALVQTSDDTNKKIVKVPPSSALVASQAEIAQKCVAKNEDYGLDYISANARLNCSVIVSTLQRGACDIAPQNEVSLLQRVLTYYNGFIDKSTLSGGIFGSLTEKYLVEFQEKNNVSATGIVDAQTRPQLMEFCLKLKASAQKRVSQEYANLQEAQAVLANDQKIQLIRTLAPFVLAVKSSARSDIPHAKSFVANWGDTILGTQRLIDEVQNRKVDTTSIEEMSSATNNIQAIWGDIGRKQAQLLEAYRTIPQAELTILNANAL